ncbi:hypothetical protein LWC33_13675 [Pseudonocardia sp. RS11V-5]|uniref:hypothetical protein n=1 Tax=Pseudonocardia terrae TaxID=2905831 RepID=UPI001E30CFFA|nr:hypothetical protein [Pseudonocardia terrae]MCE3552506.1 hypothetical protein [Pseudonocardia terrae]
MPDGDEWRAIAALAGRSGKVDPRGELAGAAVILVVAVALAVAGLLSLNLGLLVGAVIVGTAGAIWWGEARRKQAKERARRHP